MEDVAPAKCLIPLVFLSLAIEWPAVPREVIILYQDIHPLQLFAGFPRGVGDMWKRVGKEPLTLQRVTLGIKSIPLHP